VGPKKGLQGIRLATDKELRQWKLPKGSLGPVDFPRNALVVADTAISMDAPYVCGANTEGRHLKDIVLSRDARVEIRGTIRKITNDEACSICGKPLQILRGIEVGHVFYLGTKYSKAMKLEVTLESSKNELMEMGCYGIGVGRTIAACIEQNHDKDGIIWPLAMAPYSVGIVTLGEGRQVQESHELYMKLRDLGIDAIWDDRPISPGVKLKDMDLIGIPFQVVIGDRGLQREIVEWKRRGANEKVEVPVGQILEHIQSVLKDEQLKVKNQLEALK
jgi:prolyl-tRNA synthetase